MTTQDFDELEPKPPSTGGATSPLALWLLALTMLILFGIMFLALNTIRQGKNSLETQLETIQTTLAAEPQANPTSEALMDQMRGVMAESAALRSASESLKAQYINWPALIRVIGDFDIRLMQLSRLMQQDKLITLTGEGIDEMQVMAYATRLRESGFFSRVTIQALNTVQPTAPDGTTASTTRIAQFSIVIELNMTPGS